MYLHFGWTNIEISWSKFNCCLHKQIYSTGIVLVFAGSWECNMNKHMQNFIKLSQLNNRYQGRGGGGGGICGFVFLQWKPLWWHLRFKLFIDHFQRMLWIWENEWVRDRRGDEVWHSAFINVNLNSIIQLDVKTGSSESKSWIFYITPVTRNVAII